MNILQTIKSLDRGRVVRKAQKSLSEVIGGVIKTGGKGKLDISLEVVISDHDAGAVLVKGIVKKNVPETGHPAQVHFVTGLDSDGGMLGLTRRDPSQPPLAGMNDEEEEDAEGPKRRTVTVIDGQQSAAGEKAVETA